MASADNDCNHCGLTGMACDCVVLTREEYRTLKARIADLEAQVKKAEEAQRENMWTCRDHFDEAIDARSCGVCEFYQEQAHRKDLEAQVKTLEVRGRVYAEEGCKYLDRIKDLEARLAEAQNMAFVKVQLLDEAQARLKESEAARGQAVDQLRKDSESVSVTFHSMREERDAILARLEAQGRVKTEAEAVLAHVEGRLQFMGDTDRLVFAKLRDAIKASC